MFVSELVKVVATVSSYKGRYAFSKETLGCHLSRTHIKSKYNRAILALDDGYG